MSSGLSGSEAAQLAEKNIEERKRKKIDEERQIEEYNERNKLYSKILQHDIYKNANPDPIIISLIIIAIICTVWILYTFLLKPSITGEWIDTKGNSWYIDKHILDDEADVMIYDNYRDMPVYGTCTINDNLFSFNNIIGVWDYSDIVLFVGGGGIRRVH